MSNNKKLGFTVVELLVIIVVVAILAAISTVAYINFQKNARNALRTQVAGQTVKMANMIVAKHKTDTIRDTLYNSGGWYHACIGTGYVDLNDDGVGDCSIYGDGSSFIMSESLEFNKLLSRNTTLVNVADFPTITTGGYVQYGPFFQSSWVDAEHGWIVEFSLEGEEVPCRIGPLVYKASDGSYTTTAPTSNDQWSISENGITECMVLID